MKTITQCTKVGLFLLLFCITTFGATVAELTDAYNATPTADNAKAVIAEMQLVNDPGLIAFAERAYADTGNKDFPDIICNEYWEKQDYASLETYSANIADGTNTDSRFVIWRARAMRELDEYADTAVVEYITQRYNSTLLFHDATLEKYLVELKLELQQPDAISFAATACVDGLPNDPSIYTTTLGVLEEGTDDYVSVGMAYCASHPEQFIQMNISPDLMIRALSEVDYTEDFVDLCVKQFNKLPWLDIGAGEGIDLCNKMLTAIPVMEETRRLIRIIDAKRALLIKVNATVSKPRMW